MNPDNVVATINTIAVVFLAPSAAELDDVLMNLRLNGSDLLFDDVDHNQQNYYVGKYKYSYIASS